MVIVCPRYSCASFTARSAALSAWAPVTTNRARAVEASVELHLASKPIGNSSFVPRSLSAVSGAQPLKAPFESFAVQHIAVDDAAGHPAVLDIEDGADIRRAIAGEALIGPAQGMRGHNDVVEPQQRVIGRRRLELEDIEAGAGNALVLQHRGQGLLVDDRSARRIDEKG